MKPTLTTYTIAKRYGITARRVLRLAQLRGVQPEERIGRACLWTRAQADALRPGRVGRPRVGKIRKNLDH